jgi:spore coat protein CotF
MCGIQIYNDLNEVKIKKSSPITKNKLAKKKSKDKGVKSMAKYEEKKIIELSNKEDNGDFSSIY